MTNEEFMQVLEAKLKTIIEDYVTDNIERRVARNVYGRFSEMENLLRATLNEHCPSCEKHRQIKKALRNMAAIVEDADVL